MTWSAAIRARLALVVLLSELFVVLAGSPSGARHHARSATVDVFTAQSVSARLPRDGEARAGADSRARDQAPCVMPAAVPAVAGASWHRAIFVAEPERHTRADACDERARGPPVAA